MRTRWLLAVIGFVFLASAGIALAQGGPPQLSSEWGLIVANLINTVLVLGGVQLIKKYLAPWLASQEPLYLQLLAGGLGIVMPFLTAFLTGLTGNPIHLSPLVGALTGIQAIGAFHVIKNLKKG